MNFLCYNRSMSEVAFDPQDCNNNQPGDPMLDSGWAKVRQGQIAEAQAVAANGHAFSYEDAEQTTNEDIAEAESWSDDSEPTASINDAEARESRSKKRRAEEFNDPEIGAIVRAMQHAADQRAGRFFPHR